MSRFISSVSGADISSADKPVLPAHTSLSRNSPSALAATVPAVLFLAFAATVARAPFDAESLPPSLLQAREESGEGGIQPQQPVTSDAQLIAMVHQGQWPISQTMLVRGDSAANSVSSAQWRGRLEPLPPVRGRAPLAGQVSRVAVKVGQRVAVNDPVLELSAGPTSRAGGSGSRAERRQTAAESAQVQAANQQAKLQQKMRAAQMQLVASQDRVARAQRRVDAARDIVRRLQRGETVPVPENALTEPARPVREVAAPRETAADVARRKTLAAAQDAQKEARAAQSKATAAEREAVASEAKSKAAAIAAKDARAAVAGIQKNFDAGTVKASALDTARAAAEDAEGAAKTAVTAAATARQSADSLSEKARTAQAASETATAGATRSLRDVSVFGNSAEKTREAAAEPAPKAAGGTLSVDDAARMARAALNESETAVKQAQQLKERVDTYSRQVNATRSDLDTSSKQLASAQDAVLDQTITTNLSQVRAPAGGIVESVATVAQNVSDGDVVVAIGQRDRLRVVWTDSTGAWRKLREDDQIPVVVRAAYGDRSVSARIDDIERTGNNARIVAVLDNPVVGDTRRWQPGVEVRAAIPGAPPQQAQAVLREFETEVPTGAVVDVSAGASPYADARIAVLVPQPGSRFYRIEWRDVQFLLDGRSQHTVQGVFPGERIALRPALLPKNAKMLQLVG